MRVAHRAKRGMPEGVEGDRMSPYVLKAKPPIPEIILNTL